MGILDEDVGAFERARMVRRGSIALTALVLAASAILGPACGPKAQPATTPATPPPPATRSSSAAASKWTHGGKEVADLTGDDFKKEIAASAGSVVLVNVWALWCAPCLRELPDLLRLKAHYPGRIRMMLISADPPTDRAAVAGRLAQIGVDFRTYMKAASDMDFINALNPEWTGALPETMLFDARGGRVAAWEGIVPTNTIDDSIRDLLAKGGVAKGTP
jgi:thiol-disulfide isomerase/thioredoxin